MTRFWKGAMSSSQRDKNRQTCRFRERSISRRANSSWSWRSFQSGFYLSEGEISGLNFLMSLLWGERDTQTMHRRLAVLAADFLMLIPLKSPIGYRLYAVGDTSDP